MDIKIFGTGFKNGTYRRKAIAREKKEESAFYRNGTAYIVSLCGNPKEVISTINHEFLHHVLEKKTCDQFSWDLDNLCLKKNACRRCIANV